MHARRTGGAAGSLLVLFGWMTVARADSPPEFTYAAPADCPGADDFAAAVSVRGRTIVAASSTSKPAISIAVTKDPKGYRGALTMGEGAKREVHGTTCREVVDALAIVTAGALSPVVAVAEASAPAPVTSSAPVHDEPPAPVAAPSAPAPTLPVAPPPSSNVGLAPDKLHVEAGTLAFERDVTVSLLGGVSYGLLPGVTMPRLDAVFSIVNLAIPPGAAAYRVGPLVRVRASLFGEGRKESELDTTRARGFSVAIELCIPLYYERVGFRALICPQFSGGQLELKTSNKADGAVTQKKIAGFGTTGFNLDLSYVLFRHLHLGVELGGEAILGDLTAERADGARVFEPGRWTFRGAFGIGAAF